ncbi:Ras family protein [Tritrichomonas foetus]|uniref:Ras family protein n=1 Tax=Tritrichomonas foetus TaxID=1144522 RepID=A0A1J4JN20_9EUKA|nr:Ras family protein [Tritrichomonas foetus]|eukprot:OHT00475.1 Ras family protein [Tritrichomonas foetus]
MTETNCYKIVVVGSSGVGKTAIVQRLIDNTFSIENQSTVGVEFKSFNVDVDGKNCKLSIWDTAGQERFRSVSKAYFRNAVGAILCFALDDPDSFQDLNGWLNDLHSLAAPNAAILLVGNKSDLTENRCITENDGLEFSKRYNIQYIETSAKDGTNIIDSFIRLTRTIIDKVKTGEIKGTFQSPATPPISQPIRQPNTEKSKCCK